jgi:hypothetical protein
MPPTLPLIAFCKRTTEMPSLDDETSAPWQAAQLAAYKDAPSGGVAAGGGVAEFVSESAINCMSAAGKLVSMPIPPRLEAMALCMFLTVATPRRLVPPMAPWQPAQFAV